MRSFLAISLLLVLALGAFGTASADDSLLAVTFFDVGQGDAALIQCDGKAMLVDTGLAKSSGKLLGYLVQLGVTTLDYVMITHPHGDHVGGLNDVLRAFQVKKLITPDAPYGRGSSCYEYALTLVNEQQLEMEVPTPGLTYQLGSATLTILAPNSETYVDENDYSIVFRLEHGGNSFLFAGDATEVSEAEILAAGYQLDANVLKVGNHGFMDASSSAFLDAIVPEYAIISCGPEVSYFEPHDEVISALMAREITVLRTDHDGPVTFVSNGETLGMQGIRR